MGSSLSKQSAGVEMITEWNSKPAHVLLVSLNKLELYLQAVDRLQNSPRFSELMPIAMTRLKREFEAALIMYQSAVNRQTTRQPAPGSAAGSSSTFSETSSMLTYDDYVGYDLPNQNFIIQLKGIAERLHLGGNLAESVAIYTKARKEFLKHQLYEINFHELKISKNTKWLKLDNLNVKVELWIQVSKICVNILFQCEKQLCEQIFEGIGGNSVKDECFMGTVKDFAIELFAFAQAVGESNQPYERMETVLSLDNAFLSILPDVEALFGSELARVITKGWTETSVWIENDVCRMLYDLKKAVFNEIPTFCDHNGGVHNTTKYVMDQVDHIMRNRGMLTTLIKSCPSTLIFDGWAIPQEVIQDTSNRSFLEQHLIVIIVVLRRNLEGKAKGYKDSCLGNLFMMNNIRYIVLKIQGSHKLQEMIGDSSLERLNKDVKLAMNNYLDLTCKKFLTCLANKEMNSTRCFCWGLSKFVLRRRLKSFNTVYEEIEASHPLCTVPDLQLKEQICRSLSEKLVPAYKNFLAKFTSNPETDEKNFKYSVQDLEALIIEKLFAFT